MTERLQSKSIQTILSGLVTNSAEFIKRPVLIPIAAHQRPRYTVITLDTRHTVYKPQKNV